MFYNGIYICSMVQSSSGLCSHNCIMQSLHSYNDVSCKVFRVI